MSEWMDEVHEGTSRFGLKVRRTLVDTHSEYQRITIVDTEAYGLALLLDGLFMAAEHEEATYHEMLTHPALVTAPSIQRVLVVGGGDGGTVREVLRHPDVQEVDLVEVDALVVELCKKHLRRIGTAWDDPRLDVHIGDGAEWVRDCAPGYYDVILVDGSDPIGPAKVLFGAHFLKGCAQALTPEGVFAAQAGSPSLQRGMHLELVRGLRRLFQDVHPYYGPVSIYPGGAWSWVWATNGRAVPDQPIRGRLRQLERRTHYFNRGILRGAFGVPNHILQALEE
jgi:spermidine synthase